MKFTSKTDTIKLIIIILPLKLLESRLSTTKEKNEK